MERTQRRGVRVLWTELCKDAELRGKWVALQGVRYDSGNPVEGEVIDSDADLASLCARIQAGDYGACAILHVDDRQSGIRRLSTAV